MKHDMPVETNNTLNCRNALDCVNIDNTWLADEERAAILSEAGIQLWVVRQEQRWCTSKSCPAIRVEIDPFSLLSLLSCLFNHLDGVSQVELTSS